MSHAVATTLVGTVGYTAPEVYSSSGYGFAVDYFSIGVLIYVMLTCENLDEAAKGSMKNTRIEEIVREKLNHVSEDARNIIRHLLDANPEERISVFEETAIGWKEDSKNNDDDDDDDKKFRYATRMGNLLLHQPWFVRK
jgi:serine/threonine protein kinase